MVLGEKVAIFNWERGRNSAPREGQKIFCGQTSSFGGKGKKTTWDTWCTFQDVSLAYVSLSRVPPEESLITNMPILEHFNVLGSRL